MVSSSWRERCFLHSPILFLGQSGEGGILPRKKKNNPFLVEFMQNSPCLGIFEHNVMWHAISLNLCISYFFIGISEFQSHDISFWIFGNQEIPLPLYFGESPTGIQKFHTGIPGIPTKNQAKKYTWIKKEESFTLGKQEDSC